MEKTDRISVTRPELAAGFGKLGLGKGDAVLVHSSLKSLGQVEGGAACVIGGLLDVIGEAGTLVVPTLTGKREDSPAAPPVFDVEATPCWTGRIAETVRCMPGAVRSLHPTHSVAAVGARAAYFTRGHEFSQSPCDKESPYWKNGLEGGYILLIGVDQESNTTIHACEEIAGVPYHLQKEVTDGLVKGYGGTVVQVKNRLHDWGKPPTDFNRLDALYGERGIMKTGTVGNAVVRLIDAARMLEFTVGLLQRDPLYLLK